MSKKIATLMHISHLSNSNIDTHSICEYVKDRNRIILDIVISDLKTGSEMVINIFETRTLEFGQNVFDIQKLTKSLSYDFFDTDKFDKIMISNFESIDNSNDDTVIAVREKEMYKEFVQLVHKFIVSRGNADLF